MKGVSSTGTSRIVSLDQFRGYTVAGMVLVNFLGGAQAVPAILKHHGVSCSYADTIMPQFFFAVGFALRLTFLNNAERHGSSAAYRRGLKRCLSLILLGLVFHNLDPVGRTWAEMRAAGWGGFLTKSLHVSAFQTLTHIGVTSLWILPVIGARSSILVLFASMSGLTHLALSRLFYFDFVFEQGVIDGGPLGFLTWTVPALAGALAHDVLKRREAREAFGPFVAASAMLMALGYAISCIGPFEIARESGTPWRLTTCLAAPPFGAVPSGRDLWMMSQQAGTLSYQVFSAGFSLFVFAACVYLCDIRGWQLGVFRTFGQNPLAAYILHSMVSECVSAFRPDDSPLWWVTLMLVLYFWITYVFVRFLERQGLYLRL